MSCVILAQSSVPQNIISVIFCMLKDSDRIYIASDSKFDFSLRWIPEVTHVCHSWREVALSNSFLWTDINVSASISWAVEFGRRSGQAPIRIWSNAPASYSFQFNPKIGKCMKTLLHENMKRIREINIINADAKDILLAPVSADKELQPFPILESLTITGNTQPMSSFLLTNRNMVAPNLRKLSLEGCPIGEDFGSFRNLSHLSISDRGSPKTTAIFLRNALSGMSKLESLELVLTSAPMSISRVDFGKQVAPLPKLRKLDIDGWPIGLAISILQAISHGPLRHVGIGGCRTHRLDQVLHLFNCITPHAIGNQNIDRFELVFGRVDQEFMISCRMGQNFLGEVILSDTGPPSQADDPSLFLLEGLLRTINYQDLEHLELHLPQSLSTSLWMEHFGQLRLLTSIGTSHGERELFKALMDGLSEDAADVTTTPSFPALKELRIEKRSKLYPEEDIEVMLQYLRKRLDLGIGLKKLSFTIEEEQPDDFDINDIGIDDDLETLKEDLKAQLEVFRDVVESMEVTDWM